MTDFALPSTPPPAITELGHIVAGVWLQTPPDDQGLPGFVRVDAITAISAWASETTGRVEVRHDDGDSTVVARILPSTTARLTAAAKRDAVLGATGVACQVIAGMLAPLLGPSIDYAMAPDAGAPGGGA